MNGDLSQPSGDRVIVVLGGNAFVKPGDDLTMAGQFRVAHEALGQLRPLFLPENEVVITHGNGPQVGHILTRVEESLGKAYAIPLGACVAESEGELGYVLEQALYNMLAEQGVARPIASLLTQVVVDADDPAFAEPTKPIGPFYHQLRARAMEHQGFAMREDVGRGYRRVVPSPRPLEILELEVIDQLLGSGAIVIAAGGGGIPVVREDGRLKGVEAVVDKDLASALLGEGLGAKRMVVLTGVPCAYQDFNQPNQQPIRRISVPEARQFVTEGHFAAGSMLPKIEASIQFSSRPGAQTVICDLPSLPAALKGEAGTIVEASGCDEETVEKTHG